MGQDTGRALLVATVVLLSVGSGVAMRPATESVGPVATIDATPSDPNAAESTHAVTVPLATSAGSLGQPWNDVVVNYTADPSADVSNVGAGSIERVGIDRDDDAPGTRIDVAATVTSASGMRDGRAVRVTLEGNLTLQPSDEIVVVLRPVQNPQREGNATVEVTINSQGAADTATGTVTYEYNSADVAMDNQTTNGSIVTVRSVTLSEGGFVAVQNESGAAPDAVRGHSTYLDAGSHQNVTVRLDEPLSKTRTLTAQAYTDTNGDQRFQYDSSGGTTDTPYRTKDGSLMGTDAATVRVPGSDPDETQPTDTPTPTVTPASDTPTDARTPTESGGSATPSDSPTPTPTTTSDTTRTNTPTEAGSDDSPSTRTRTTADSGPGFSIGAALVAVLVPVALVALVTVALVVWRRP